MVFMADHEGDAAGLRDLTRLWLDLCDCGGPQPSLNNPRADEHAADCRYRREVEDGDSGRRQGRR